MQTLRISNDKAILRFNTISTLVKTIVLLLQNRINESIDAETQKSKDLDWLINNYEQASKQKNRRGKNEVVKLPDNFNPRTILSGKDIKKGNKKEQKDFIDTSLIFNSEDFKTAKTINEEE